MVINFANFSFAQNRRLWNAQEIDYPNTANVAPIAVIVATLNARTIEQRVTLLFRLFVRHGSCPFRPLRRIPLAKLFSKSSSRAVWLVSKFVKACQNDDLAAARGGYYPFRPFFCFISISLASFHFFLAFLLSIISPRFDLRGWASPRSCLANACRNFSGVYITYVVQNVFKRY